MNPKRVIGFMTGVFFFGVFCWITAALGHARLPSEIVFIDPSVPDAAIIEAHLPQGAEVVRLSPEMDGVAQISAHLAEKRDLSAIRIISHGNRGHFVLNGKRIDRDFLRDRGDRISAWGQALARSGDILLYACNLAFGEKGKGFVDAIGELTGANVGASCNVIGKGGDWHLEYSRGLIESAPLNIQGYTHHLADQVVTNNNDDGAGSLRQAIAVVGSGEEITFDADYTITLASELAISKNLTISGTGAENTIIQANASPNTATYRVFNITAGTVTLENMTIRYGNPLEEHGGGIYNTATLTINNSTICNNRSYRTIYQGFGGGIYNSSTLTINNSTVNGNTVSNIRTSNNAYARGGGIYNTDSTSTLTINNSTVFDNTASATSDSGNAYGQGGGLYISNGTATISSSTISGNRVSATASGAAGKEGAGLVLERESLTVRNSIIAQNLDNSTNYDYYWNFFGTLTDSGYNIVEYQSGTSTGSGKTFTATTDILFNTKADGTTGYSTWNQNNSDLANKNLNLAASLADNGGPTQTLALSSGSFVINTIPQDTTGSGGGDAYNGCPPCDQRIYSRPDGSTEPDDNRDIGAYEYGASLLVELSSFTAQGFEDHMLLEWATASEIDNAGFHLWRSNAEDGEYLRITEVLISAEGGATWGAEYEYEDFDVVSGLTYYYQLEDIDYDGISTFNGPVSATLGDEAIVLIFPEDSTLIPVYPSAMFEWDGAGLERFKLGFSRSPDFTGKVIVLPRGSKRHGAWITGESYTPNRREWRKIQHLGRRGGSVYWAVFGEDEAGEGFVSKTFELKIED